MIAKATELKAAIKLAPRGPSPERKAARLALNQERARVIAELNGVRKAARAALDAAPAPSGPPEDGRPTGRTAARRALIVARLSIELARTTFTADGNGKREATGTGSAAGGPAADTAKPTPLRMKDATTEQVEAAIAEMIRVTTAFSACRTPEGMALPACLQDNRKTCRKAFDEAITAGVQADVAEADAKLIIARLAVQLNKKATNAAATATGAEDADATRTAPTGDATAAAASAAAANPTPGGDVWAITLENAPADLLGLATAKDATVQQRLEELRAAIEGAERDDYKEAFRAELREFRTRSMVELHAEHRANREQYAVAATAEDRAGARAKLIVSRLAIATLRNGFRGHQNHHHHGDHGCHGRRHGCWGSSAAPMRGPRAMTAIGLKLIKNGHLQNYFGCGGPHKHRHMGRPAQARHISGADSGAPRPAPHGNIPQHRHRGPHHGPRHGGRADLRMMCTPGPAGWNGRHAY